MRIISILRAPLLLLLPFLTLVSAASNTLWSDQAAYCAAPTSGIFIQDFAVTYYRSNNSIVFYFTLNSTAAGNNVNANVYVNAYGMDLVNRTVDICSLVNGVLCPLPQLNISAYGTFQLPDDVNIPSIAYSVPNLEAWARLTLTNTNGTEALCVQTTLTNGLTTELLAVKIATGVFTAVALLVGLFHGLANTASPAQYRWFDILFLFQAAAATGFLNLNYPSAYRAFTRNFAWSHALFGSNGMQNTINQMRYKTGGTLSGNITSSLSLIDRASSPYNNYVDINSIIEQVQALANALSGLGRLTGRSLSTRQQQLGGGLSNSVSNVGSTFGNTGIPIYTTSQGIPYPNVMTTVFFFFLAFVGVFLLFHGIVFLCAACGGRSIWAQDLRRKFWLWMGGNALLMCLMWSFPIWIFAFFQFRIRDSSLAIFWGAFGIFLTFIPLLSIFIFSILRGRKRSSASPGISKLYTSYNWFHSAGSLYRAYRQRFHWFWFVFVLAIIARSGFIVFGPQDGFAQVIGLVVVEAIVFVLLLACRPHKDKKGDWLAPFLSFCRLAAFGLLIAFIPRVGVAAITRTIIGFVIIVLFGIPVVLLFLGLIFNLGYGWIWRQHEDRIEDGLEVERYVASEDSSLRPAMVQTTPPTPRDSTYIDPNAHNHRTSLIEPVTNYQDNRSYGYDDPVGSPTAYAYNDTAANRRTSAPVRSGASTPYGPGLAGVGTTRPLSTGGSTRTGQSQYFTPMGEVDEGRDQGEQRRWSRDQYFDTTNQNQARY